MEDNKDVNLEGLTGDSLSQMTPRQQHEVWDLFTKQYASSIGKTISNINSNKSLYTPQLGNNTMGEIGGKAKAPTQKDLEKWLAQPDKFQKQLRQTSQYFSSAIMQYNRSVDHFKKILTFDYDMRMSSPFIPELKKQIFDARNRSLNFLRDFNVKYHSSLIMDRIMHNGGAFYYLQKGDDFNTLLELPIDYCYITGRWDRGFTFAIDLTWFDKIGSMKESMPEIYSYYETFIKIRKSGQRDLIKQYQYYPVPIENGVVFTFGINDVDLIPPLTGVFRDANRIFAYKNLLMQKTSLDTWKIIGQKIPLHKDSQTPLFSPEQAQVFVDFVQSVLPDGTAVFATPMEFEEVDLAGAASKDNIVGRGEELYWRSIGVNGTMMDAGDKSATTLAYSLENDAAYVEQIYTQYENFLNLQLRIISRTHRFNVKFYGNKYSKDKEIKTYKDAIISINAPVGKLYALLGYEPFEVLPTIELENALGIKEKSIPIVSGFQQSGDSESGAPKKDESDLTASGTQARVDDTNANREG